MKTKLSLPEIQPMNKPNLNEIDHSVREPTVEDTEIDEETMKRELKIKPKIQAASKSCHEDGYIWGISILHNSRLKMCLTSLNYATVLGFLLYKIFNSENFSSQSSIDNNMVFISYVNLITNFLLLFDIFSHRAQSSKNFTNVIFLVHSFRTLIWVCCILYVEYGYKLIFLIYLEFLVELFLYFYELKEVIGECIGAVFLIILLSMFKVKNRYRDSFSMFEYMMSRGKGYMNILTFLISLINVLFWPKVFGIVSASWGWALSPLIVILFFPSFGFLLYLVSLTNSKNVFSHSMFMFLSISFCSFFLIFLLEDFFKNEMFNKVIVFLILLYFLTLSLLVFFGSIMKIETYDNVGSRARIMKQKSFMQKRKQLKKEKKSKKEEKRELKRYLSMKKVKTNIFSKKNSSLVFNEKERGKYCFVCYIKESSIIYQPCLHGGICETCARDLISVEKECPFCNKKLTGAVIYETEKDKFLKKGEIKI